MIITVEELRRYIQTDEDDSALEAWLQALESMIRRYTNNNFQHRGYRRTADIQGGTFLMDMQSPFQIDDTVQISASVENDGLYTVLTADDRTFTVKESVLDERAVLVTKVVYPPDVKMGVVNLMKWELQNRDKVGVQSETISRHSVTYFNMDGDNSTMGYPKSLLGFLRPYMKARFGQGVGV